MRPRWIALACFLLSAPLTWGMRLESLRAPSEESKTIEEIGFPSVMLDVALRRISQVAGAAAAPTAATANTAAANATVAAGSTEVMDELAVRRGADPKTEKEAELKTGKVKIPTAADIAFEREMKKMTQGDAVSQALEEQNAMQLRQQRVTNRSIKQIRQISSKAQARIKRLVTLAKVQEELRVRAIEEAKRALAAAANEFEDMAHKLSQGKRDKAASDKLAADRAKADAEVAQLQKDEDQDSDAPQTKAAPAATPAPTTAPAATTTATTTPSAVKAKFVSIRYLLDNAKDSLDNVMRLERRDKETLEEEAIA